MFFSFFSFFRFPFPFRALRRPRPSTLHAVVLGNGRPRARDEDRSRSRRGRDRLLPAGDGRRVRGQRQQRRGAEQGGRHRGRRRNRYGSRLVFFFVIAFTSPSVPLSRIGVTAVRRPSRGAKARLGNGFCPGAAAAPPSVDPRGRRRFFRRKRSAFVACTSDHARRTRPDRTPF